MQTAPCRGSRLRSHPDGPGVVLRLFHSGPGTFWTNLGDKNMTLMLPAPGATPPPAPPEK